MVLHHREPEFVFEQVGLFKVKVTVMIDSLRECNNIQARLIPEAEKKKKEEEKTLHDFL